ncbi:MAG: hypothetical protein NTV93_19385 [Verrucomicrobia bacterium]|nr:hypothetical protein [Verrucomicrobiota bacterium]
MIGYYLLRHPALRYFLVIPEHVFLLNPADRGYGRLGTSFSPGKKQGRQHRNATNGNQELKQGKPRASQIWIVTLRYRVEKHDSNARELGRTHTSALIQTPREIKSFIFSLISL